MALEPYIAHHLKNKLLSNSNSQRLDSVRSKLRFLSSSMTDVEATLVAISLVPCDFKSRDFKSRDFKSRFQVIAITMLQCEHLRLWLPCFAKENAPPPPTPKKTHEEKSTIKTNPWRKANTKLHNGFQARGILKNRWTWTCATKRSERGIATSWSNRLRVLATMFALCVNLPRRLPRECSRQLQQCSRKCKQKALAVVHLLGFHLFCSLATCHDERTSRILEHSMCTRKHTHPSMLDNG